MRFSRRAIVDDVLEKCQASALEMIDKLLTMENKAPSTVHYPRLAFYKDGFLNAYRDARVAMFRRAGSRLSREELIARDVFDPTLVYMANARAYFQRSHLFLYLPNFLQIAYLTSFF